MSAATRSESNRLSAQGTPGLRRPDSGPIRVGPLDITGHRLLEVLLEASMPSDRTPTGGGKPSPVRPALHSNPPLIKEYRS